MVCFQALKAGGLDAYVEYTGTALTTILKKPPTGDPRSVLDQVRQELEREGVTTLDPLGFENTFAMLMRRSTAQPLGIRTISDLRNHTATIRAGFGPEFMNRPDGYPGLVRAYGLNFAFRPGRWTATCSTRHLPKARSTWPRATRPTGGSLALDLVTLVDDLHYFPPYEAVPLARSETLRRHRELRPALNALAGQLDADTMRKLNHQVDGQHRDPAEVALEFLKSKGLIGK